MQCVTGNVMYTMIPLEWPLTLRLLPFSGRHLGFPVDSILTLNAAFHSRTIFRKSHKDTVASFSVPKICRIKRTGG